MSKRLNKEVYNRGKPRYKGKQNNSNEPEVSWHMPDLSLVLPKHYHSKAKEPLIEIDGSLLEGGGQILRISAALSCILAQPITISKIRACRPKPGLKAQHLAGIKLVSLVCEGELEGGSMNSSTVTLIPRCIRSGEYTVDTKTAGSVCLLLQTVLPCLLFAPLPSTLVLKGGTDADFAPPVDYYRYTWDYHARMLGVRCGVSEVVRGFFPRGCGEVHVSVDPVTVLKPLTMTERGLITKVTIHVYMCGTLPSSLAERCIHTAENIVKRRFSGTQVPVLSTFSRDDRSFGNGWGLRITAESSSGCRLTSSGNGNPKIAPEQLASETAEKLIRDVDEGGCVDSYLQDQLIILMALAEGTSRVRTGPLTLHTKTAIHVVERMTQAQFGVTKDENCNLGENCYIVECKGIGLHNIYLQNEEN